MSGPCTLEYLLIQATILGARALLRSARGVRQGLGEAREDALRAYQEGTARERQLRERERGAVRDLARRIASLEAGLARMSALTEALQPSLAEAGQALVIALPALPVERDTQSLERYAAELEEALERAQQELAAAGARMSASSAATIDAGTLERLTHPRSLADLLDAYATASRQDRAAEASVARQAKLEKLLEPLQGEAAVPPAIEALLHELAGAPDESRAEALVLELRREVAAERARRATEARQRSAAEALIAGLDEFESDDARANALRQTLELAAAGLVDFDDDLASRARSLIDTLRAEAAQATRAAAAEVLEATLKDLGFVVEPIAETLFIEGGVAHFTRAEWGEYAVRLRAAPGEATLNFNVVREPGAAHEDALSAHLRDGRAEEAWCAHIPRLQETLDRRGIRLKVRRLLGAGEAPAQVVPQGTLGALRTETAATAAPAAPLQQPLG